MPNDQMSTFRPYPSFTMTSGAIHPLVPDVPLVTGSFLLNCTESPRSPAKYFVRISSFVNYKHLYSPNFTSPSFDSKIFALLISRWILFRWWSLANPFRDFKREKTKKKWDMHNKLQIQKYTSLQINAISLSFKVWISRRSLKLPPLMYSIIICVNLFINPKIITINGEKKRRTIFFCEREQLTEREKGREGERREGREKREKEVKWRE